MSDSMEKSKDVIIDLACMSYEDAMQMAMLEAKIQRAGLLRERLRQPDAPSSIMDELLDLSSPETLEKVFGQVRAQMAKVVKRISPEWFVNGAPEGMPLDDPETYKHLRADKARELRQMIQNAQAEKN